MKERKSEIKLSYITGLRDVVLAEIGQREDLHVVREEGDSVYLEYGGGLIDRVIKKLWSVARAYIVLQDSHYHPPYISNHKSILGDLVDIVTLGHESEFKSFKITCAGADSPEVREIAKYIGEKYTLSEKEEADLKIHIIKQNGVWEVGIQISPRPLSYRSYKVKNMGGAMDPTIAYAMNSFGVLDKAKTYLNIFSGSGTLAIEAGLCYPNLERLVGFDNDKKHLSLAVQNIKEAGLIKKITLKEGNIFERPELGVFDVITSDLPFGMAVSKDEDLAKLYRSFVAYCEESLNPDGRLVVYTAEYEILEKILKESKFTVVEKVELKFMTSVDAYLRPRIMVCRFQ